MANNWQLNTIVTAQSGRPFSVMSGTNRSVNGMGMDTADVVGDWQRPAGVDPVFMWFNTAAFAVTQPGSVGTAGRNILRGDARQIVNFPAFRNIPMTERLRAQFRFEAFNFFNHTNLSNPVASVNNVNFGKVQGAGDPRVIQLGLRLLF